MLGNVGSSATYQIAHVYTDVVPPVTSTPLKITHTISFLSRVTVNTVTRSNSPVSGALISVTYLSSGKAPQTETCNTSIVQDSSSNSQTGQCSVDIVVDGISDNSVNITISASKTNSYFFYNTVPGPIYDTLPSNSIFKYTMVDNSSVAVSGTVYYQGILLKFAG